MKLFGILPIALFASATSASSPASAFCSSRRLTNCGLSTSQLDGEAGAQTRGGFISTAAVAVASAAIINPLQPAYARGRATLEAAYDRYSPRIVEGGKFYKGQVFGAISKGDWKFIESATAEPPEVQRGSGIARWRYRQTSSPGRWLQRQSGTCCDGLVRGYIFRVQYLSQNESDEGRSRKAKRSSTRIE